MRPVDGTQTGGPTHHLDSQAEPLLPARLQMRLHRLRACTAAEATCWHWIRLRAWLTSIPRWGFCLVAAATVLCKTSSLRSTALSKDLHCQQAGLQPDSQLAAA